MNGYECIVLCFAIIAWTLIWVIDSKDNSSK